VSFGRWCGRLHRFRFVVLRPLASGRRNSRSHHQAESAVKRPPRTVTIDTRAGQTLTGVLRNEDNFSLQLQTLDGTFHLLMKSDVASVKRDSNSLMPADYGSTLSAGDLNDLVSYLISVAQHDKSLIRRKPSLATKKNKVKQKLLPELISLHPRHCKKETTNGAVKNGLIVTEGNAGGVPEGVRLDRQGINITGPRASQSS